MLSTQRVFLADCTATSCSLPLPPLSPPEPVCCCGVKLLAWKIQGEAEGNAETHVWLCVDVESGGRRSGNIFVLALCEWLDTDSREATSGLHKKYSYGTLHGDALLTLVIHGTHHILSAATISFS